MSSTAFNSATSLGSQASTGWEVSTMREGEFPLHIEGFGQGIIKVCLYMGRRTSLQ